VIILALYYLAGPALLTVLWLHVRKDFCPVQMCFRTLHATLETLIILPLVALSCYTKVW